MGKGILVGERVICSNLNIKEVIDINAQIKRILLKTWTKVELSGQNDDINRNIENSMYLLLHHGRFQKGCF